MWVLDIWGLGAGLVFNGAVSHRPHSSDSSDSSEPRRLAEPAFAGDTGEADPAVATALASYAAGRTPYVEVLAALCEARVLVPVVAVLGEVEYDAAGLPRDKSADMATVLLTGADGRQGLLAFSSLATLQTWQADARPVPTAVRDAADAALHDGATALLVDLAGPVPFAIEEQDLRALAAGYTLARVGESTAWVKPS